MLSLLPKRINHDQLYDELRPLLRYAKSADDRLTGMSVLVLMYPSPGLASLVDPLKIALAHHGGEPITVTLLLKKVSETLLPYINKLVKRSPETGPEDRRWYWAASAILDGARYPGLSNWLVDESLGWPAVAAESSGERFIEHLDLLQKAMDERLDPPLGRPPGDLIQVISQMAVAGPSICALRALKRLSPSLEWDSPALLQGAIRISEGFRTLFNLPETIALLRGNEPETYYWKLALRHCLHGNIQSLLDEQSHCLVESLGVVDESEVERTKAIGNAIGSSLSVRTSQLQLDEIIIRPNLRKVEFEGYNTRCRFALRFAELKDETGSTVARADTVRVAFNSPFRPFILASTSIGQEGLDFHTWCHSVIHWNLPSNPVDLEQREGRVHRYKGHAIRKNIAKTYGLEALRTGWDRHGDPWNFMFVQAENDRPLGVNDLVPYWVFEVDGGARIERRVPILAFSKEEFHYHRLKRMLAVYRLVFGQPRQEDLLEHLASRSDSISLDHARDAWRISLEPPES
jgi:hypothetical protein